MRRRSVWWTDNDVSEQCLTFRLLAVLLIYCFLVYLHFRCVYVTVLCIYKQGRRSCGVAGIRTPLKMSHCFTQNCCCITASFTTSRMNSLGHYHFTDFAYAGDATILFLISSKQTVCSNQCLCCYTGYLSWPKTKLQNVGTDDPPSTILIDGVPVDGVEEFIYRGSKQISNGATADWMLYAGLDLPVQ